MFSAKHQHESPIGIPMREGTYGLKIFLKSITLLVGRRMHKSTQWWNMVEYVYMCVYRQTRIHTHTCSLLGLPYNNRLIWLKTTEFYFLTVLEVWFLLRPLPLAWRWLPSCCILTLPFFCAQASLVSLHLPKCYLLMRIPIILE